MWFVIGLLIVCAAFYIYIYRGWSFKGKIIFKSILLGITLFCTVLMVILLIWSIGGTFASEKDKTLATRLNTVERDVNNGMYTDMAFWLDIDMDYEPEFDYLWERLQMYASYNQYVIFAAAQEREELADEFVGKAEYYKNEFIKLCQNPACAENEEFGEFYLEQTGLLDK